MLASMPAVCRAGFGGAACDVCGGDKPNYGPGTRPIGTECMACPGIGSADGGGGVGGFQFLDPKGGKNWFSPRVIAAIAATQASECIGEFTQIVDNAWSLAPQVRLAQPCWGLRRQLGALIGVPRGWGRGLE